MSLDGTRRPWQEGPEEDVPAESWLGVNDDELLHRVQTHDPREDADERFLDIVASDRHFFIRQEAAKRIRRKKLLFPYEDDRHIGQILVRHLNRREDLTYLERLMAHSRHAEVRTAAKMQLVRLRRRLSDVARRETAGGGSQGRTVWKIAVVHRDQAVRRLVADTLARPEFEVTGHESDGASVAAIQANPPHLVMAGIEDVSGEARLRTALRAMEPYVPLVVLCGAESTDRLSQLLGDGVDEFMLLPVTPALLAAKTRALLHLANLAPRRSERRKASGPIGEDGVLPLLRLCEEEHLTCRLVVSLEGRRWFADFVGGELTEAGGVPPLDDQEALAAILAVRSGAYDIIEASSDEEEADEAPSAAAFPGVISAPGPAGLELRPGAAEGSEHDDVDTTLLGWAIHFIVEQAWVHLGTAATTALLRRTLHDRLDRHPILRTFGVEENAHVSVDFARGPRLPGSAVAATAQWMAAFLTSARRIAPEAAGIDVRQATRLVADALEAVDFYAAFEFAAAQKVKPTTMPIAKMTPTRSPR